MMVDRRLSCQLLDTKTKMVREKTENAACVVVYVVCGRWWVSLRYRNVCAQQHSRSIATRNDLWEESRQNRRKISRWASNIRLPSWERTHSLLVIRQRQAIYIALRCPLTRSSLHLRGIFYIILHGYLQTLCNLFVSHNQQQHVVAAVPPTSRRIPRTHGAADDNTTTSSKQLCTSTNPFQTNVFGCCTDSNSIICKTTTTTTTSSLLFEKYIVFGSLLFFKSPSMPRW